MGDSTARAVGACHACEAKIGVAASWELRFLLDHALMLLFFSMRYMEDTWVSELDQLPRC